MGLGEGNGQGKGVVWLGRMDEVSVQARVRFGVKVQVRAIVMVMCTAG